ncbi:flavodoxin [Paenibacillus durus]|uniref:Flavodoxin-like domain-containing protein n=1 Tax=Paenibacillus durus ATCC 35681 TaxID=1333534 RepID=A0A0F7FA09_PAEDU|nr:flavodoxin [Paenibacillus durus]AKG34813.1 hypothetical protein VK70_09720 [Paenibacillus durus ATCC 35681]
MKCLTTKWYCLALSFLLLLSLTACGSSSQNSSTQQPTPEIQEPSTVADENDNTDEVTNVPEAGTSKILVAYFSRIGNANLPDNVDTISSASLNNTENGVQGNTEILAKMIQKSVNGDLFLIEMEDKYPAEYSIIERQGLEERDAKIRPKLASHVENMDSYDVIYLGYPNWWFDMPMALYSFLEEYDLSGKTIVPFNTSGGSRFSHTIETIRELQPGATVSEGLTISQTLPDGTEDEVTDWLSKLGLPE